MTTLQTGAPHFKSLAKQYRHANYTLSKALNEFVDNAIKRATELRVLTQVDDNKRLQELLISDNIELGFDSIDQTGVNNPFNMGHIKVAHEDDSETSEFGVGMKAGALSAANQLNVYTRVKITEGKFKYVEVICDFIRMAGEIDVNASYNPRIREISYEEYREYHPFDQGSTIKLSKIRECIYSRTTQDEITDYICKELSATYTRFISKGVVIEVNGTRVEPNYNFFEDPKCSPFTVKKELYILAKEGLPIKYLIRQTKEHVTWQEYNRESDEWNKLELYSDGLECIANLQKNGYYFVYAPFTDDGVCLQLKTTFAFYSDMFHRQDGNDHPILDDALLIHKDDRNYGKQSIFVHRNGCHNYTVHEMDFVSKRLGKDIGITFTKEILMNGNNELIKAIKSALVDSKKGYSSDTCSGINTKLCEKAIRLGLIDLETCHEKKLAKRFRLESSDNDSVSTESKKSSAKAKKISKKLIKSSKPDIASSESTTQEDSLVRPEEPIVESQSQITTTQELNLSESSVQESELKDLTESTDEPENSTRRRMIDITVRLKKMIADDLELSDEILSAIEQLIQ